jgi:hypothetical protein
MLHQSPLQVCTCFNVVAVSVRKNQLHARFHCGNSCSHPYHFYPLLSIYREKGGKEKIFYLPFYTLLLAVGGTSSDVELTAKERILECLFE